MSCVLLALLVLELVLLDVGVPHAVLDVEILHAVRHGVAPDVLASQSLAPADVGASRLLCVGVSAFLLHEAAERHVGALALAPADDGLAARLRRLQVVVPGLRPAQAEVVLRLVAPGYVLPPNIKCIYIYIYIYAPM